MNEKEVRNELQSLAAELQTIADKNEERAYSGEFDNEEFLRGASLGFEDSSDAIERKIEELFEEDDD